jgi:protein-tyrosine kinase
MNPAVDPTDTLGPMASLRKTVDTLWTHLAPAGKPQSLRRILFTAPRSGQGTTTVALCAALGLARHLQAKVTLVETGAPSATLAALLGAEPQPGLSEVLAGEAERESAIRQGLDSELIVMPAGSRPIQPGALNGDLARGLLEWLGQRRDFLLIDAPPLLLHPEARPLMWEADQIVVVLEAGRTRKDEARALVQALNEAQVEVLGCVLNRYRPDLPSWIGGSSLA